MQLTLTFLVAALATFATAASVPKPLKCAKGSCTLLVDAES